MTFPLADVDPNQWLIPIVTAITGILGGGFGKKWLDTRSRAQADVNEREALLWGQVNQQLGKLEAKVEQLESKIAHLEQQNDRKQRLIHVRNLLVQELRGEVNDLLEGQGKPGKYPAPLIGDLLADDADDDDEEHRNG